VGFGRGENIYVINAAITTSKIVAAVDSFETLYVQINKLEALIDRCIDGLSYQRSRTAFMG
jgi:hypothetical protein